MLTNDVRGKSIRVGTGIAFGVGKDVDFRGALASAAGRPHAAQAIRASEVRRQTR